VLVAALAVHIDWTWKRKLSPRGGRYFFHRVELAVPSFRQSDEKWRDDPLGGVEANGTIGGEGCAVAAAAMVFKFYGVENGWVYWDRAAWFAPDRVRHAYEDLASYQLIDSNLSRGTLLSYGCGCEAASRISSSSPAKTGSTISCAIPAPALRKGSTHCASLAATSKGYDFTSRSRILVCNTPCSGERKLRRLSRQTPLPFLSVQLSTPFA